MPPFLIVPILVVVAIIVLALAFASRYKTVSPDEAMIVTGASLGKKNSTTDASGRTIKIVRGGGAFIIPVFQRVQRISLLSHKLDVSTPEVYTEQGVPVMADESLCTYQDAERLIAADAVDVFNLRLGKNGGFLASRRLVELARSHRLGLHLGTMVGETGILSAAGEIFGSRIAEFACLDGRGQNEWLLARDVVVDGAARKHGLGIAVSRSAVLSL